MDVNAAISIVGIALTALSIVIGISIRQQKKRDKRADERQRQLIACQALDKGFIERTADLTHKVAVCAREKKLFNGDLDTEIREYEQIKGKRDKFYNELIGENIVKGG